MGVARANGGHRAEQGRKRRGKRGEEGEGVEHLADAQESKRSALPASVQCGVISTEGLSDNLACTEGAGVRISPVVALTRSIILCVLSATFHLAPRPLPSYSNLATTLPHT
jgi:hypothetical protein